MTMPRGLGPKFGTCVPSALTTSEINSLQLPTIPSLSGLPSNGPGGAAGAAGAPAFPSPPLPFCCRAEERRVGKERRAGRSDDHRKVRELTDDGKMETGGVLTRLRAPADTARTGGASVA